MSPWHLKGHPCCTHRRASSLGLSGGLLLALMRISSIAPRWIATLYVLFRGIRRCWFLHRSVTVFLAFKIRSWIVSDSDDTAWVWFRQLTLVRFCVRACSDPKGQMEAALPGYVHTRAMISIIIPQAFPGSAPLTNEVILLTKDSSLVYLLGVTVSQYELAKFDRESLTAA